MPINLTAWSLTVLSFSHKTTEAMNTASCASLATEWVNDAIERERSSTGSLEEAIHRVARFFGLTVRRVKSYRWKRVTFVSADEFLRVQSKRADRLRHARLQAEQELAALDALLDKLERSHGPTA